MDFDSQLISIQLSDIMDNIEANDTSDDCMISLNMILKIILILLIIFIIYKLFICKSHSKKKQDTKNKN